MINAPLILLAVISHLVVYGPLHGISSTAPTSDPGVSTDSLRLREAEDHSVEVQVAKPLRRDLAYTITLPANIAPLYQTTLYAKISGYLWWIGPDKGDPVKKGDLLAVIDAPEVEEQYHQALSDYKIKKLTYERLAKVWTESPDVIAKQDVDVAEAAYHGAKHSMEQREALRAYTKVRAPYDGTITARFADPGALIQVATSSATGAIPLFTIMDLNTVRVYTNVPQDEMGWIMPGKTKATLTVGGATGGSFTGTVTRTALALDPSTRTLLVEIDLPNPDHALRPGTFAQVTLSLREIAQALVVPPQAIVTHGATTSVFVVQDGVATTRHIQTGLSDGRWIAVASGLSGKEEVVVVGKQKMRDGVSVRTSPFKLPDAASAQQKFERRSAGNTTPHQKIHNQAPTAAAAPNTVPDPVR
jgi:RND family efflux transporter MFP subunit